MGSLIRKTFSVPPLSCNCSILADLETKEAIVIDPGGNADAILREVDELGCVVTMVLHTHAHFDHFLASGHIKRATNAVLCLHLDDRHLWNMLELQCRMFGVGYLQAPPLDRWLQDEEQIYVGKVPGEVIHTPGHSPGSLSYYFEGANVLFSGDTLFRGGIGRTDLWGGDERAIEQSIRDRLYSLKEDTLVIPGHGSETQIGFEKQYNAFFTA
jgi:hydroxyacylglutathione hydrolase